MGAIQIKCSKKGVVLDIPPSCGRDTTRVMTQLTSPAFHAMKIQEKRQHFVCPVFGKQQSRFTKKKSTVHVLLLGSMNLKPGTSHQESMEWKSLGMGWNGVPQSGPAFGHTYSMFRPGMLKKKNENLPLRAYFEGSGQGSPWKAKGRG